MWGHLLAARWNWEATGRGETRDPRVLPRWGAWIVQGDVGDPTLASEPF